VKNDLRSYDYVIDVIDIEKLDELLASIDLDNRSVVIYGAAACGRNCYTHLLYKNIMAECFVDRNEWLQKEVPFLKPVLSLEQFRKQYVGQIIFVASFKAEVAEEIVSVLSNFVDTDNIYIIPVKRVYDTLHLPNNEYRVAGKWNCVSRFIESPLITVVSVVYNTPEGYLRRAIESVLKQTFQRFEYLIIDHASDDRTTAQIIKEYACVDSRIRVIRTKVNYVNELKRGKEKDLSQLYEVFVKNIKSPYACVIDSDDCYNEAYLETAYTLLRQYGADTYFMGAVSYNEANYQEGNLWASFHLPPQNRIAITEEDKAFLYANAYKSIGGWGMLTKTELLLKGYRSMWVNTSLTSDLKGAFTVMLESSKCVFGETVCLYYVNRDNSITATYTKVQIEQRLTNIIDLCIIERLDILRNMLKGSDGRKKAVLYNYSEYHLMVLILYLAELCEMDISRSDKQMIISKLEVLKKDEYIIDVLNSRTYYVQELQRITDILKMA